MTDAETVKAWECIAYHKECSESEECPYYMDNYNMCDNISLAKDVLDIYNRQRATIEKCADTLCKKEDMTQLIAEERNQYYNELQAAKAEIERLKKEISISQHLLSDAWRNIEIKDKFCETARAEAIKEFAERLEDEAYGNDLYDRSGYPINAIPINILLQVKKEMIGDNNAE